MQLPDHNSRLPVQTSAQQPEILGCLFQLRVKLLEKYQRRFVHAAGARHSPWNLLSNERVLSHTDSLGSSCNISVTEQSLRAPRTLSTVISPSRGTVTPVSLFLNHYLLQQRRLMFVVAAPFAVGSHLFRPLTVGPCLFHNKPLAIVSLGSAPTLAPNSLLAFLAFS